MASRFYLAHFTVSHIIRTPDGEMIVDCLSDNDEIERAGAKHSTESVFRMTTRAERSPLHIH